MAQTNRPSQAEKAASQAKRGKSSVKSKAKTSAKAPAKKPVAQDVKQKNEQSNKDREYVRIPSRFISAAIMLGLFVLFLVMLFTHDGKIVNLIYNFVLGLIGYIGFYVSIPALLYLLAICNHPLYWLIRYDKSLSFCLLLPHTGRQF